MLAITVLLHGVFVLLVWRAMQPPASVAAHAPVSDMLEVRFIAAAPVRGTAPAPPLQLPPPPRVPPKRRPEPPAKDAMTVQLASPKTPTPASATSAPRLFDRNGQVRLPASAASAPVPEYVQHLPQGDTRIMQHRSPVTYQATRFDKDWGNGSSNAIDNVLQKVVDKTTVKHTFHLPRGIRIHCGISLAMLAGGCGGDPPPPPSAKDGDVRLNMAPAKPLAPDTQAPKPPSVAACIALYRAGKPLADGCPSDTPIRAVDEELRRHAKGVPPAH